MAHLKQARSFGDFLIVSLTVDSHVNKGPGRPIYTWRDRADLLRELRCVDDVVPSYTGLQAIRFQMPDIYVKGIDYKDGGAEEDMALCRSLGVEMRFTDTPKFSSTETFNRIEAFERVHPMWERTATSLPPRDEVLAVVRKFSNMQGGTVDETATWDGEHWHRVPDGEIFNKNDCHLWRRLET